MPSWNIHAAHVERLLREEDAARLGIRDIGCFHFGNFVPDIYVGWMVPDVSRTMPYAETHVATPSAIPVPRYDEFWNAFIGGRTPDEVSDVTLGAWAHLVCDAGYNAAVKSYIAAAGVRAGDRTRIRKQGDFELFGRTFFLTHTVRTTDLLLEECAAFPQYPVEAEDVVRSVHVADDIIASTNEHHLACEPDYSLLTPEFLERTAASVDEMLLGGLRTFGESSIVPYV